MPGFLAFELYLAFLCLTSAAFAAAPTVSLLVLRKRPGLKSGFLFSLLAPPLPLFPLLLHLLRLQIYLRFIDRC